MVKKVSGTSGFLKMSTGSGMVKAGKACLVLSFAAPSSLSSAFSALKATYGRAMHFNAQPWLASSRSCCWSNSTMLWKPKGFSSPLMGNGSTKLARG